MEILQDEQLSVRPATTSDSQLLADWWNDGKVMAHAGFPDGVHTSAAEVAGKLTADSDETGRRLILMKETEAIGEMDYQIVAFGVAEIGIKICREDLREKGYGRRFLTLLIDYLIAAGNQKIQLSTMIENKRAQHVYERLGFQQAAIREAVWQGPTGIWHTAVYYELTAEKWLTQKITIE